MYLCFMDSPHQVGSLRILSEDWRGWSSVVYSCLRSGLRLLSSTCLSRSPFLLPAPPELLQPSDTQTRTTPQDWKPTSDSCTFPCSPLVFYILFLGFKLKVCTQRVTHKTPISALNWKDTTAKNSSSCPGSSKATYISTQQKHNRSLRRSWWVKPKLHSKNVICCQFSGWWPCSQGEQFEWVENQLHALPLHTGGATHLRAIALSRRVLSGRHWLPTRTF